MVGNQKALIGMKFDLASLSDQPQSDAPRKLTDEHRQQSGQWVEAEVLSSRELLTRLAEQYQIQIGPNTLRPKLKRLGYIWKRTRYSFKKARPRTLRTIPSVHRPIDSANALYNFLASVILSKKYENGFRKNFNV